MAKSKKPGQKNRVVHRPQIGTFIEKSGRQAPEVQEEYGYEVELQQSDVPAEKVQSDARAGSGSQVAAEKHTSPKVLLKPLIIIVAGMGIMIVIKLLVNLVSG